MKFNRREVAGEEIMSARPSSVGRPGGEEIRSSGTDQRKKFNATAKQGTRHVFTNHESLPSCQEAYRSFIKLYPDFVGRLRVLDDIRANEYGHLQERGHVCFDYSGYGLFSHLQQEVDKPSSSFGLAYISANLPTHALYGGAEEGTVESDISKRIMNFLNIRESEYSMVFTASRGSAFKLLAECYPFHINKRLLTVYDYENEAVTWMEETARKKGANVMNGLFRWPSLRLISSDLRKKILEKKKKKETAKGLFVFPLQSRATGVKYSYQWMPQVQQNDWHVLLDASALGPKDMDSLGVSLFQPDFIISSFFKVYGSDPTGFGCLFIKNSAIRCLHNSSAARGVGMVRLVPLPVSTPNLLCAASVSEGDETFEVDKYDCTESPKNNAFRSELTCIQSFSGSVATSYSDHKLTESGASLSGSEVGIVAEIEVDKHLSESESCANGCSAIDSRVHRPCLRDHENEDLNQCSAINGKSPVPTTDDDIKNGNHSEMEINGVSAYLYRTVDGELQNFPHSSRSNNFEGLNKVEKICPVIVENEKDQIPIKADNMGASGSMHEGAASLCLLEDRTAYKLDRNAGETEVHVVTDGVIKSHADVYYKPVSEAGMPEAFPLSVGSSRLLDELSINGKADAPEELPESVESLTEQKRVIQDYSVQDQKISDAAETVIKVDSYLSMEAANSIRVNSTMVDECCSIPVAPKRSLNVVVESECHAGGARKDHSICGDGFLEGHIDRECNLSTDTVTCEAFPLGFSIDDRVNNVEELPEVVKNSLEQQKQVIQAYSVPQQKYSNIVEDTIKADYYVKLEPGDPGNGKIVGINEFHAIPVAQGSQYMNPKVENESEVGVVREHHSIDSDGFLKCDSDEEDKLFGDADKSEAFHHSVDRNEPLHWLLINGKADSAEQLPELVEGLSKHHTQIVRDFSLEQHKVNSDLDETVKGNSYFEQKFEDPGSGDARHINECYATHVAQEKECWIPMVQSECHVKDAREDHSSEHLFGEPASFDERENSDTESVNGGQKVSQKEAEIISQGGNSRLEGMSPQKSDHCFELEADSYVSRDACSSSQQYSFNDNRINSICNCSEGAYYLDRQGDLSFISSERDSVSIYHADDMPNESTMARTEPRILCMGLNHADALDLSKVNTRHRYLINWLVGSMLKLRHPGPDNAVPLVQIYGPKVKYDRGAFLAFNLFDWKGILLQPILVQRLADRSNISLGVASLCHIELPENPTEWQGVLDPMKSSAEEHRSMGVKSATLQVVNVSFGLLTDFEDAYRLWAFLAKFLDADFVSKEVLRYRSLNQETVVVGM